MQSLGRCMPPGLKCNSGEERKLPLSLLLACTLLSLGIAAPMHGAFAGGLDELSTRLDKVESLWGERRTLVADERKAVGSQQQAIGKKIGQNDKSRLRIIADAVDLLSGYDLLADCQKLMETGEEVQRLVNALQREQDIILKDPYWGPERGPQRVSELGIDKLFERAMGQLSKLSGEIRKRCEDEVRQPSQLPGEDGIIAWFERQAPVVKAALIGAIASIIGSLVAIVVAVIRRRD